MDIIAYEDDIFYDPLGMKVWEKRHQYCNNIIKTFCCTKILDIGCNEGKFIQRLTRDEQMILLVGLDYDMNALEIARDELKPEPIQDQIQKLRKQRLEVKLFYGDATKKSQIIKNFDFDAITLIEVIEHLHISQLSDLCENIFGYLNPKLLIITTPNSDFNIYFRQKDKQFIFRHPDHKFEMNRQEFNIWANQQAQKYGYKLQFDGVSSHKSGEMIYGYCSQLAIFVRNDHINLSNTYMIENETILFENIDYPFDERTKQQKIVDSISYLTLCSKIKNLSEDEARFIYELDYDQSLLRISDIMMDDDIRQYIDNSDDLIEIIRNNLDRKKYSIINKLNQYYLLIQQPLSDQEYQSDNVIQLE